MATKRQKASKTQPYSLTCDECGTNVVGHTGHVGKKHKACGGRVRGGGKSTKSCGIWK